MNKKEVIEKIKNLNARETFMSEIIWVKRDDVLDIINQLDEPEKPVLSKEEAEWLEHLKLIGNFTHCLYVITRQGWGCDFEFRSHGKKYKLSCASENDGDENELTKNRLVNALIYGYEVEKEKLYRARHKLTGEYLSQNYAKTGYYHGLDHFHILKLSKKDWEELGVLDDKVYEIEEVKE
ncbi:DUF1642 domain-containing protein [Streptococcus gallolyticus]|jgi:hypothetical protein|uniref:DUF1642 domain-containing protein n=1 Tax=Streptococcus gallolyticus TaxID=315405 RepID=UPI0015F31FB0|nr:DUF1642 domain-containing protein [Streptococcus gallolyticus]